MKQTEYQRLLLADLQQTAQAVVRELKGEKRNKVVVFDGEMGAGKTTFIKELCRALGVAEVVNSPTFSIVNEYEATDGERIFHFDFYRINSAQEAQDIGCEEYFYSGDFCFVEWPDKVAPLLPPDCAEIQIVKNDDETRTIVLTLN